MIRAYKFLMRPTVGQQGALAEMLRDHCSLYNAALQERRDAYRHASKTTVRYVQQSAQPVDASHSDANKVTGTGSAAAGIYNNGATFTALTNSSVNNNIAPLAPAPGGIYTTVAITNTTGSTVTGNTPTNCVFSPAPVTGCVN